MFFPTIDNPDYYDDYISDSYWSQDKFKLQFKMYQN